jgi:hypothetical protein
MVAVDQQGSVAGSGVGVMVTGGASEAKTVAMVTLPQMPSTSRSFWL